MTDPFAQYPEAEQWVREAFEQELAGYHLAFGRMVKMRIRSNRHGEVEQLRFETPAAQVVVKRVGGTPEQRLNRRERRE